MCAQYGTTALDMAKANRKTEVAAYLETPPVVLALEVDEDGSGRVANLGGEEVARIGTEVMGLAEGDAKQARIRAAIKEQSGLVRFSVVVPAAEESSEREAGELGVKTKSDVLAPGDVEVDVAEHEV